MGKRITFLFIFGILLVALMGTSVAASLDKKTVIVLYKNEVDDADIDDLEKIGADVKYVYNIIPGIAISVDELDIDEIEEDEDVDVVVFEQIYHIMLSSSIPQINADDVHAQGGTGSGVKVCIVDTGIDDSHAALPSLVAWKDFINNQPNPYDDHSHGTHVAGTVASSDSFYKGVAPGASLMGAKVCTSTGSCPTPDIIAGIDWCVTNGADIISMSIGGGAFTSTCDGEPTAQAANNAVAQGVFVAAASGNDGYINAISAPSCGSDVMAIGAVDDFDGRTIFSNEGNELDVVAPGVSIVSTVPGNGFVGMSGTSMATPHASGTAALLLGKDSSLTPAQVRTILRDTALDLGSPGFDTIYGHGRIDALAAYEAVSGTTPPPTPPPGENATFSDTVSWSVTGGQNTFTWNPQACPGAIDCHLSKIEVEVEIEAISEENSGTGHVGIDNNDAGTSPNNYPVRQSVSPEGRYGPVFTCGGDNPGNFPDTCSLSKSDGFDLESYVVTLFANTDSDGDTVTSVTRIRYTWTWSIVPACSADSECDDGLFCNGVETCQSGVCVPGTPVDCSSLNDQCNVGVCEETSDSCVTQPANEGSSCEDGLFCNVGETCQAGSCAGGSARVCSDGNSCTIDSCSEAAGSCVNTSVQDGTLCEDGQFCTLNTVCTTGVCGGGTPRDCSDPVSCTVDSCDEASNSCVNNPDNSLCSDGLVCNGVEICDALLDCQAGTPVVCNDSNICTTDSCSEALGQCQFTPIPTCLVAPVAPTGLTASADEDLIDLNWIPNSEPDLTGYKIYRSTSSGGPYSQIVSVGLVTSYIDEGIEGLFYYVVTAVNQAGEESDFSNEASATAED